MPIFQNLIFFRFDVLSCGGGLCIRGRQHLRWQIVEPCRRASWSLTTFLNNVSGFGSRYTLVILQKVATYWWMRRNLALKFVDVDLEFIGGFPQNSVWAVALSCSVRRDLMPCGLRLRKCNAEMDAK
jgi:hypothetical protein